MGHGVSLGRTEKKRGETTAAAVAATPPAAQNANPAAKRASRTTRAAAPSEHRNSNAPVYSSTQVEVETKAGSQYPSSNKRSTSLSRKGAGSPQKAIITERMVAQFTKETQVSREEEKLNKERAVMDWCNQLQFPIPQYQDALYRHDASMAALRGAVSPQSR